MLAGREIPARKQEKVILDFMRRSLVYASPSVLRALRVWRDALPQNENWSHEQTKAMMLKYEAFVKAMRKDLGVSNWGLAEGDLGRAVNSDWDEYFAGSDPALPPEPDGTSPEEQIRASERERR